MTALDRSGGLVTREALIDLLYGDDPNGGPEDPLDSIKIFIHKIRKKIIVAELPIRIDTVWGQGWRRAWTDGRDPKRTLSRLAFLVCFSLLMIHPLLAMASMFCDDHDKLAAGLQETFGEVRVSMAWTATGGLLERYENPVTKTWTLTLYPVNSQACIVSHGEYWYERKPEAREPQA